MSYGFNKTKNNRWEIYFKDDLLATVGNRRLWKSIRQLIEKEFSVKKDPKGEIVPIEVVER